MFIGHFALGFAAKKATPKTPLQTLFAASVLADVLWPIFLALGVEQVSIDPGNTAMTPLDFVSYPYSHSLVMLIVWAAVFGGVYLARKKDLRGAVILAALVVSHWVLDWITHRPDMPIYPGGPKFGLGLWNYPQLTWAVEVAMFAVGVFMYARATRARDGQGKWGFWFLVLLFLAAYFADAMSSTPPPSVQAIWIGALVATAVTLILAWWVDRHREPTALAAAVSG
jgi:membrane-bound metal-dependent hydrolase YbcI (DUF457 family)